MQENFAKSERTMNIFLETAQWDFIKWCYAEEFPASWLQSKFWKDAGKGTNRQYLGVLNRSIIGVIVSLAVAPNYFVVRNCSIKGIREQFNAVSFYLPYQLMSIQSKRGSPNTSVCFRYTRLSSKWHSRPISPPRRSETSGKAVRSPLFSINLKAFQCCQVASPSNKLGRVSGYFLSANPLLLS